MRKARYLLCLIVVIIGIVSTAGALPSHGFDITYYSDATFTEVVGNRYYNCGGSISQWGIRTAYYDAFDWECDSGDFFCTHCVDGDCHYTMCD
jgi:hypothetical protein